MSPWGFEIDFNNVATVGSIELAALSVRANNLLLIKLLFDDKTLFFD